MRKILASSIALTILMSGAQSVVMEQTAHAAKSKVTYKTIMKKKVIKFTSSTVKTDDLPLGETKVTVEGKNGYKLQLFKQTLKDGKVIKTKYVKTKKSVSPVNKITLIGTKIVSKIDEVKPPEHVIKTELLIVKDPLDYQTEYRDDPTLPNGEIVVIREGKKGVREKAYNQTIIDGEVHSTTPAYVRIVTEPINRIVRIGTKKDPVKADKDIQSIPVSEMKQELGYNTLYKDGRYDSDTTALHQGYRIGQKTWNGYTVSEVKIGIDSTFDEMKKLSAEERYSKSKNTENTVVLTKGTERHFIGMKANFKTQKMFNELKLYDIDVLNQEFIKLVNVERASLGIAPLIIDSKMKQGNEIRAQEMANYGTISINGKAHSRPDGSWGTTAFEYMGKDSVPGEISWAGTFGGNFYKLTSEKALAEAVYLGWKSSKAGHHEAMINPNHKSVYLSIKIGEDPKNFTNANGKLNILVGNAVFLNK